MKQQVAIAAFLIHGVVWGTAGIATVNTAKGTAESSVAVAIGWLAGLMFLGWLWSRPVADALGAMVRRSLISWACMAAGLVLLLIIRLSF